METIVERRATSVAMRKARTNSSAVEASRPRVELCDYSSSAIFFLSMQMVRTYLSQAPIKLLVAKASPILTLFFSPPDTPRIAAFPTGVPFTWFKPNMVERTLVTSVI